MTVNFQFLLLGFSFLFMTSCKQNTNREVADTVKTEYNSYVKGFTSGVIRRDDRIEVHFVNLEGLDAIDPDDLITIDPKVDGQANWSGRTLHFYPTDRWTPGQSYTATINLDNIPAIADNSKNFRFTFDIIKPSFSLKNIRLQSENTADLNTHILTGEVHMSDEVDTEKIEKALRVSPGMSGKEVIWQHHAAMNVHHFRVDNIQRKNQAFDIRVFVDGNKMGIDKEDSKTIRVPATGTFQYLNIEVNNGNDQAAVIDFSDPLDTKQETEGLVQIYPDIPIRLIIQDNQLKIIPKKRQVGKFTVTVFNHLENIKGQLLDGSVSRSIEFFDEKPQVALLKEGAIIPRSEGLKFPFRAVNLRALRLRIVHIFEDNVAFFLQRNEIGGRSEVKRAGRLIYNDVIHLKTERPVDFRSWNNYSFNLEHYVDVEPGAIYRVYLTLERPYSLYPCATDSVTSQDDIQVVSWDSRVNESDNDFWNYYGYQPEVDWRNYRHHEANNPCKPSYYKSQNATVSQSIVASDLGIIAKKGSDNYIQVAVSDLLSTKAKSGVKVDVYTFQHTLIGSGTTDADGMVKIETQGRPYLLTAREGADVGYLRLDGGSTESVSMFQVSGQNNPDQIKGFIYGERGVWRPGDSIYLQFIIQDKERHLPADHPIVFEWYNPKNQLIHQRMRTLGQNFIHDFRLKTNTLDPTGAWRALVKVGNNTFEKAIRVETVKPNRLKMDIEFPDKVISITDGVLSSKFFSNWLHGAKASGLNADVKMKLRAGNTNFDGYEGFRFDDASKLFRISEKEIFKGKLDQNGEAQLTTKVTGKNAPGMLTAQFTSRVFEKGGEFSIDRKVVTLSPYTAYVGVKIPKGSGWRGALKPKDTRVAKIAFLDPSGKPLNGTIEVNIYGLSWRWWYDHNQGENLSNFMRSKNNRLLSTQSVEVKNGEAFYDLPDLKYYGTYILIARDTRGQHSASQVFRYYWNRADSDKKESSQMLQFELSQETYHVDEKIEINIPSNGQGHFIVSLEHADDVVEMKRIKAASDNTKVTFYAAPELIPNAYIYVSYIQPHAQTANDLPIRMYGVQPVYIEDSATHLKPKIKAADKWKPEQKVPVTISEENGNDMEYTLAIVDEGLLQLTRFDTPDPGLHFIKRKRSPYAHGICMMTSSAHMPARWRACWLSEVMEM